MSTRAMARQYSSGGSSSGGAGFGQLFRKLTGYDNVEGGPKLIRKEDGTVDIEPGEYRGKNREKVGQMNAEMIQAIIPYITQRMRGTNDLDVEKLRQSGSLTTERTRADLEKEITILKQQLGELSKTGVTYRSPADIQVHGEALNDPRIRNALAGEASQGSIMADPEYQRSLIAGAIQKNRAQGFINQKNSEVSAPANSITAFTDPTTMGQNMLRGPLMQPQSITQSGGVPFTDKTTGETSTIGGKTTVSGGGYDRGGMFPQAPQGLIDEASKRVTLGDSANNDSVEHQLKLLGLTPEQIRELVIKSVPRIIR